MTENKTEDEATFGSDVYVYCRSHLAPHKTGWCTVDPRDKIKLDAKDYASATQECQDKGLELYNPGAK